MTRRFARSRRRSGRCPRGWRLAGNYLGRIGVAALLEQAEAAANRVAAELTAALQAFSAVTGPQYRSDTMRPC